MPSQADPQPSKSGIVTDESSGERHIPESTRADGSTRKAIKIRPGYRPPEDVEVYKNRTAESFRTRGKGGVPGAETLKEDAAAAQPVSAASNKNAKRREARKKAKAAEDAGSGAAPTTSPGQETDPQAEAEKKARNLRKKLKQAKELENKRDAGEGLLPEQIAKVIKINELVRELEALGLDADEPKGEESKPS